MRQAQLENGTVLEFPDDTSDEVMDRVVQQHVRDSQPPGVAERITNAVGAVAPSVARGMIQSGLSGRSAANWLGAYSNEDLAQESRRAGRRLEEFAPDPETRAQMQTIEQSPDLLSAVGNIITNPRGTAAYIGESLPGSAAAAGLGAVAMPLVGGVAAGGAALGLLGRAAVPIAQRVGLALGMGSGSAALEGGSAVLERLADPNGPYRVDIRDPQALQAALDNPQIMNDVRAYVAPRAAIVGGFDALTAGVAGRVVAPTRHAATRWAGETAAQAAGGAGGELGAQLAQEGRMTNPAAVALEGISEGIMGVPEILMGRGIEARRGNVEREERERLGREEAARRQQIRETYGGFVNDEVDMINVLHSQGMTDDQISTLPFEQLVRLSNAAIADDVIRAHGQDPNTISPEQRLVAARRLQGSIARDTERGPSFETPMDSTYFDRIREASGQFPAAERKAVRRAIGAYEAAVAKNDEAGALRQFERVQNVLQAITKDKPQLLVDAGINPNLLKGRGGFGYRPNGRTIYAGQPKEEADLRRWVDVPGHPEGGYWLTDNPRLGKSDLFFGRPEDQDALKEGILKGVERRVADLAKNWPEYMRLTKWGFAPKENINLDNPRQMTADEEELADEFGLKAFWGTDRGDIARTREALDLLAKEFNIPKEAIGFGGKMNFFSETIRALNGFTGRAMHERKSLGLSTDTKAMMVLNGDNFAGTVAHEWAHALDQAIGEAFRERSVISHATKPSPNILQSKPGLAHAIARLNEALLNSEFADRAYEADRQSGQAYLAAPTELLARALEAVMAKARPGSVFDRALQEKYSRVPHWYPNLNELGRIENAIRDVVGELNFTPVPGRRPGKFGYKILAPGGQNLRQRTASDGRFLGVDSTDNASRVENAPSTRAEQTPDAHPAQVQAQADLETAKNAPPEIAQALEKRAENQERFSKIKTEEPETPKIVSVPLAKAQEESMGPTDDFKRMSIFNRWVNTPMFNAVKFPLLRPFQNALFKMERMRSEKMHFYLDRLKPLQDLSRAETREVTRFAEVMNSMRVKPELKDGKYTVTVPDYAKTGIRKGMLNSAIKFSKPGDVITLSGKQAQAYTQMREALDKFYDDMRDSILAKFGLKPGSTKAEIGKRIGELRRTQGSAVEKMRATREANRLGILEDILDEFNSAKIEGYIPQMRAGKVRLVAVKAKMDSHGNPLKDSSGNFIPVESSDPRDRTQVLSFDGWNVNKAARRADAYKAKLAKELGKGWFFQVRPSDQDAFLAQIAPSEKNLNMVEAMANLFLKGDKGLNLEVQRDEDGQARTVSALDLFLDQVAKLKEQAKKRGIKANFSQRRDFAGWLREENIETYLPNAVGSYLVRGADQLALNYTEVERQEARNSLLKNKRADLYAYATEQEQDIYRPSTFVSAAKNAAFNWYLGWNLSSAAVNLTQLMQSSLPYLSSAGGTAKTTMHLLKASKNILPILRLSLDEDRAINWTKRPSGISQDEWAFLRRGWEEGWASAIMTKEQSGRLVAPIDNGALTSALVKTLGPKWKKAVQSMPIFFSAIEQFNRMTTGLAAFRMASEKNGLKGFQRMAEANSLYADQRLDPYLAARMAVEETQGMISKTNRPQMFRGGLGILTQFAQFPLMMMELYWRVMKAGGVDRKTALKFFPAAFLGITLTAGAWGLPGLGDANDLIKYLTKGVGPAFGIGQVDIQRELENFMRRTLREAGLSQEDSRTIPEAFLRGPSRLFPGIDLSSRAGVKFNLADMIFSSDPTNALGPFGSMIFGSIRDATGFAQNGHPYLALTALMPTFARNLVKGELSHPMAGPLLGGPETGIGPISTSTGGQRLPAGTTSRLEATQMALGFSPARLAREQELKNEIESRPMAATTENYRQQLVDLGIRQRVATREGRTEEARRFAQEAASLRQEIAAHDRGKRPDERIVTANFYSSVRRAIRSGIEGPAQTALRALPAAQEAQVRRRLRDYREP